MLNMLSKLRKKRANGENGFTLIELLVVVVIIGILIAIAIPLYLNYRKGANDKSAQSDLRGAVSVLEQCNSDNGVYPTATFALGASGIAGSCSGQTINLSGGTSFNYKFVAGTPTSYIAASTNSSGSGKYYCYNSLNGGSVAAAASAATLAAVTC